MPPSPAFDSTPPSDNRLSLKLPSNHDSLAHVVDVANAFIAERIPDEDFAYRVLLLVSEAVTNAIEHGNALDPDKSFELDMTVQPDRVDMEVRDEGEGFDPDEVRNPLKTENLFRDGGRGIFLMQTMADEVEFEDEGRCVKMVLKRSA